MARQIRLPDVFLRLARLDDQTALDALAVELEAASFCAVRPDALPGRAPVDCTLIAAHGDALIGFACWAQDEMLAVMTGVGVRARYRRFGVASALLDAVIDHLRDEGVRLLEATAQAFSPGVCALFEGLRFHAVGAHVRAPGGPSRWVTPFNERVRTEYRDVWVRYERRLSGRSRNRGDGFYA